MNYLIDSSSIHQLTLLLQFYTVFPTTDFPTSTTKDSSSTFDNIFIDYSKINSFQVFSLINWWSNHEAQYLFVNNIFD